VLASLIGTCKLNGVEPELASKTSVTKLINAHLQSRVDKLLFWSMRRNPWPPQPDRLLRYRRPCTRGAACARLAGLCLLEGRRDRPELRVVPGPRSKCGL